MTGNNDDSAASSRRSFLTRAAPAVAAALASTGAAEAQSVSSFPIDWSDNGFNGTKNIKSFNQALDFDYYPDFNWMRQAPADPKAQEYFQQTRTFTLNDIPNSAVSYSPTYEPGMFKGEQKKVVQITNTRDRISKVVMQPPLVGSGQRAPKEIEYVISNDPTAQSMDPNPDNTNKRPGSKGNGILVIPEEAVKKDNIGFTMSREGKDVVMTLTTFDPDNKNNKEPLQVTRYVLKDQLDDAKHPPITKIYVASRDKVREPIQRNIKESKIKSENLPRSGEAPGYQSMNQYTMEGKDRNIGGQLQYVNPFFFMDSLLTGILGMSEGTLRAVNRVGKDGKDERDGGEYGPLLYNEIESYDLKDLARVGRNLAEVGTTTFGIYQPDRSRENEFAQAGPKGPMDRVGRDQGTIAKA